MKIRRLKLSGFKSFVEPAELRIEPGLTGVVGPNGCGKSNLLEAIRWTMGESSPKSLRGGGMDDVIFAGTSGRPARDFAEVSILDRARGERRRRRRRKRGHAADRTRRRLGLSDRRAGRARQGRVAAIRGRRDRRPFAGAGQPGQDQRDHLRKAGRTAAHARGSGRDFRASRAAQGCRAKAARRRSKSCPARRDPLRTGTARGTAAPAGQGGGALPQAHRPDPLGRSAKFFTRAGSKPSARRGGDRRSQGGRGRSRADPPGDRGRANRARAGKSRRSPRDAPRVAELREQGHALAHQLATARARATP